MKWTRERPGAYVSGPYRVDEVAEGWAATGPGLVTREDCLWDVKAAAQRRAERANEDRLRQGGGALCEPVVGDAVLVVDGQRRGVLSAIIGGNQPDAVATFCIRFPRNRRLCVHRREFVVVTP